MPDTQEISARCLCGDYQLHLQVPRDQLPLSGSLCHCTSCRHGSGTLYIGAAYVPEACISSVQDSLSKLKASKWSDRRTMYMCEKCGSLLFGLLDGKLWFCTGALDKLEGVVKVVRQIFVQDTKDGGFSNWFKTWDGKPVENFATINDRLPANWPKSQDQKAATPTDRLHAHCVCNGVNFWIARPSASSANTSAPWSDSLIPFHSTPNPPPDPNYPWWLRANRTKFLADLCACTSCRLASSCDFVQWAFVPATDISLSTDGSVPFSRDFGTLRAYQSSENATRYFCGECGANVFWTGDERPGLIDVAVGLLDADEGALAQHWLEWASGRISFREDADMHAGTFVDHVEATFRSWGEKVSKT